MSTKTQYILEGLFFLFFGGVFAFAYFTGRLIRAKSFTFTGMILCIAVGILFFKNAVRQGKRAKRR